MDSRVAVFQKRLPENAPEHLAGDIEVAFGIVGNFKSKIAEIAADKLLSAAGKAEKIRAVRDGGFSGHMQQLREGVERDIAGLRGERLKLLPPAPDRSDIRGELQRQEIRTWLRGLPMAERSRLALESEDQLIRDAAIHAPAELSGLDPEVHKMAVAKESERLHGPRLAEFAVRESALLEAQAAIQVASDEMERIVRDATQGVAA